MKNRRKSKIYGGIEVYSKDGKLMFRCDEKKRQWYLTRNLAESISENAIRFKFETKGNGEPEAILSVEKKNECVVCGCKECDLLTPHHIVPREFRVYFPENLKSHSSLFVVCLCETCHRKYENTYASNIRKTLRAKYMPKKVKNQYEHTIPMKLLSRLLFKLTACTNHAEVKKGFLESVANLQPEDFFDYDSNQLDDLDYVHALYHRIEEHKKSQSKATPFGQMVVEALDGNYLEFSMMWVEDFFKNMSPNIDKEKFYKAIEAFVKNRMVIA